jgi:hypothetical protein
VNWNDGFWNGNVLFADIGENFNPEVGFVARRDVRNYQLKLGVKPRPEGRGFVRELNPHISLKYYTDRQDLTLTKDLHYGMKLLFGDGSQIEVSHNPAFERLLEPFELREGAVIAPGDYPFNEFRLVYNSDRTQVFSGDIQYSNGGFYDGDKTSASMSGMVLIKPRFSAELGYQYNRVDLDSSLVRADLYSLKVSYAFNPTVFLDSFIQYETDLDRVLTNVRFRWIHHPLSNLSLVFTQDRFALEGPEIPDELSWALVLKYTHLFQF